MSQPWQVNSFNSRVIKNLDDFKTEADVIVANCIVLKSQMLGIKFYSRFIWI